jgi:hypothetical protein
MSGCSLRPCVRRIRGSGGFIRTVAAFDAVVIVPLVGLVAVSAVLDLVLARHPRTEIASGVVQASGLLAFVGIYLTAIAVVLILVTRLAERITRSPRIPRVVCLVLSIALSGSCFVGLGWLANLHLWVVLLLIVLSAWAAYSVIPAGPDA